MNAFAPGLLAGKSAFVAGGTSGINLAIAEALVGAGARVAVLSRSQEKVDAAVGRLEAHGEASGYAADVRDFAAVDAALAAFHEAAGPIDIVVSGAAGNFVAPAASISSNGFRSVLEIDLLGTFHVLKAAYARLRKPGASLISISAPQSTAPAWGQAHVSAAKAGIDMLTRCLALEWGVEGVRVNAIVPGPIDDTEGMARLAPTPAIRRAMERAVPLGRFGSTLDVANLALFMASDAAAYMTGTVTYCDGGQVLTMGGALSPSALQQMLSGGG
jgi:NAD(P)-dependent dehydrogenase (short-subunit alcohol dehydrogenase family)